MKKLIILLSILLIASPLYAARSQMNAGGGSGGGVSSESDTLQTVTNRGSTTTNPVSADTVTGNYVFINDTLYPTTQPADNQLAKYDAALGRMAYEADVGAGAVGTLDQVTTAGASTTNILEVGGLGTSGDISANTVSAGTVTGNFVYIQGLVDEEVLFIDGNNGEVSGNTTLTYDGTVLTVGGDGTTGTPASRPLIVADRLINDTTQPTDGNAHCFVDASEIDKNDGTGDNSGDFAYNTFDMDVNVTGGFDYDHFACFQNSIKLHTTGETTYLYGFTDIPDIDNGDVVTRYTVMSQDFTGTGAVTDQIAHYVGVWDNAVNNYGWYSADTDTIDYFASKVGVGTNSPDRTYGSETNGFIEIAGSSNPALVIDDTGQAGEYSLVAQSDQLDIMYDSSIYVTFNNGGITEFQQGDIYIDRDSTNIAFGENQDATIGFDTNSLNIVANAVTGTDDLEITADEVVVTADVKVTGMVSATTVTGVLVYLDEVLMPWDDNPADNEIIKYDAATDRTYWEADGGGVGDFLADGTVAMTGNFNINTQAIEDANSNELVTFVTEASAVNNIQISNGATGTGVSLTAVGGDTNIDLHLEPKGIGSIRLEETLPATAGQSLAEIIMDVDSSAQVSTSEFHAILIETTGTPAGEVAAIGVVGKVDPVHQHVATLATPSQTEFAGEKHTGGTVWVDGIDGSEIFIVNSDEIYFGSATQFDEVEVIMGTAATKNVIPTFWYNTAADTWTQFFPDDGTDGFQQSGDIIWLLSGITALWTGDGDPGGADTTAGYWIKVIRTANPDPGSPTPTTVKIGLVTTYSWDKTGKITIDSIDVADFVTANTVTASTVSGNYVFINDVLYPIEQPADNELAKYDLALGRMAYEADVGAGSVPTLDEVLAVGAASTKQIEIGAIGSSGTISASTVSASTITGNLVYAEILEDTIGNTIASLNQAYGAIGVVMDGAGSAIEAGHKGYAYMTYGGVIQDVTVINSISGSIVVDIAKAAYPTLPTVDNTIVAAAPPSITAGSVAQDTTLTGWTTSFDAGDVFAFFVDSAGTVTQSVVTLKTLKD